MKERNELDQLIIARCWQQGRSLWTECPFCGSTHFHGAYKETFELGESAGTRAPHCISPRPPSEYQLIVQGQLDDEMKAKLRQRKNRWEKQCARRF